MSQLINNELKVVAVIQFNKGEALVLNRPVHFVYEQVGNDYIGTDGPLKYPLYYSHGSGNFRAFAGSEITLSMKDGSQRKIKDHWWAGHMSGHVDVVVGDIESLKKCYVFGSAQMTVEEYQALRETYTGCVYPYWDYERVIKFDDMRRDLHRRLFHEERRVRALIAEVKKKHKAQLENAAIEHAKFAGQRDDLLAALKFSREVFHAMSMQARTKGDQQYFTDLLVEGNIIDAAIANTKGGAA